MRKECAVWSAQELVDSWLALRTGCGSILVLKRSTWRLEVRFNLLATHDKSWCTERLVRRELACVQRKALGKSRYRALIQPAAEATNELSAQRRGKYDYLS